jgi:UPF0755 protein
MTPEEQLALIKTQVAGVGRDFRESLRALFHPEPPVDFVAQARQQIETAERVRTQQIVAAGLLTAVAALLLLLLVPYRGYSEPVTLVIEQGLGRRAIAAKLTDRGVLLSRWPFLLYSVLRPWNTLKAGEYRFNNPQSAAGVFSTLTRGSVYLHSVTIPEGWTRWEIADEVARLNLAGRDAFLRATEDASLISDLVPQAASLEGYLYPDTYRFARPADPQEMVRTMVGRFRTVLRELEPLPGTDTRNISEIVTLASLVEEETGARDERGLIAGVYSNRLRRGVRLGCDPTVIYAARLAFGGVFDGIIHQSDLDRESPYNTYLYPGLPPGPIASPGREALAAALHPEKTDFLYFVSNTEGGHFFARTGREHDRNVARYRRLRDQKQHQ